MTVFKPGDKVRVKGSDANRFPEGTTIVGASDGDGVWLVEYAEGLMWRNGVRVSRVRESDLELIEPLAGITPYEGIAEDIGLLSSQWWSSPKLRGASARLRAAVTPPAPKKCGKLLHHEDGYRVQRITANRRGPLTCRLDASHDGPCVPDVPAEAWK